MLPSKWCTLPTQTDCHQILFEYWLRWPSSQKQQCYYQMWWSLYLPWSSWIEISSWSCCFTLCRAAVTKLTMATFQVSCPTSNTFSIACFAAVTAATSAELRPPYRIYFLRLWCCSWSSSSLRLCSPRRIPRSWRQRLWAASLVTGNLNMTNTTIECFVNSSERIPTLSDWQLHQQPDHQ